MANGFEDRWVDAASADADVRERLVAAAGEHFGKFGYEKTTLADLAKAIGFSKTYFYRFFSSKQEIGEAICAQCFGKIVSAVEGETAAAASATETLRNVLRTVPAMSRRFHEDQPRLYDIAATASAENWGAYAAFRDDLDGRIRSIVQDGRERGEFERKTPVDEVVRAIDLCVRSFSDPRLMPLNLDAIPDGANEVISLILRSLAP